MHRISETSLRQLCLAMMHKAGLNLRSSEITANVLVKTDMWGVFTHGTRQLPKLLENFETGKMILNEKCAVVAEGQSWALIDGKRAMAFDTAVDAMSIAIKKSEVSGCATVSARNIGHFGAAGYYAFQAAQAGKIALVSCNVDPGIAAPGSTSPVLGTNPIAYGIPSEPNPIFFDVATSTVAATKVFRAKAKGEKIPSDWLVDKDGVPTTDPSKYPEEGALLPFAGHKGYGIAFLIEVLCAGLSSGPTPEKLNSWVTSTAEPVNQSFNFIVIDPAKFRAGGDFEAYIAGLVRHVKGAKKAPGYDEIKLPGDIEWKKHALASKQGIQLPVDVLKLLEAGAKKYGVTFPF